MDAAAGADGIGQIVGSGLQQPDDLQQVRFPRAVRTDQDVEGRQFEVDPLRPERQQVPDPDPSQSRRFDRRLSGHGARPPGAWPAVISFGTVRRMLPREVSAATSTSVARSRQARFEPVETARSCPSRAVRSGRCRAEEAWPSSSAKHRLNTACSRPRPVSAGGVATGPSVNKRGSGTFMTTTVYPPAGAGNSRWRGEGG